MSPARARPKPQPREAAAVRPLKYRHRSLWFRWVALEQPVPHDVDHAFEPLVGNPLAVVGWHVVGVDRVTHHGIDSDLIAALPRLRGEAMPQPVVAAALDLHGL